MKIVGNRHRAKETPSDYRRRALKLQQHADRLNPWPRPRGWVYRARTWEEYEAWRRAQENPRLW
jgi:hypothetical protein